MKYLLTMLVFGFSLSCVTAGTKSRDLSGVNPEPELSSLDNQFKTCVSDCTQKGGILIFCSDDCLKTAHAESLNNKKPLMLADDYEDCMIYCIANGGSTRGCHEVCE